MYLMIKYLIYKSEFDSRQTTKFTGVPENYHFLYRVYPILDHQTYEIKFIQGKEFIDIISPNRLIQTLCGNFVCMLDNKDETKKFIDDHNMILESITS